MEFKFTKGMIETLVEQVNNNPPIITDESVSYINELYGKYIHDVLSIQNLYQFNTFVSKISNYLNRNSIDDISSYQNMDDKKYYLLIELLKVLLYGEDEDGIAYSKKVVIPWFIKDMFMIYAESGNTYWSNFFQLDIPQDIDSDEQPSTIPINIEIKDENGLVQVVSDDATFKNVLGIIAFYNSIIPNDKIPISYYGTNFQFEQNHVKQMAQDAPYVSNRRYLIKLGQNYYSEADLTFLQGVISAALWNDYNPYEIITEFKFMHDNKLSDYTFYYGDDVVANNDFQ